MSGNDENARPPPRVWTRQEGPRVGRVGDWNNSNPPADTSRGGRGIASLGSMGGGRSAGGGGGGSSRRPAADSSDEDDDDEPKRETWFAGGERSGISIQNPDAPSGSRTARAIVEKATQNAQANQSGESSQPSAFGGGGYRLGSDEVETQFIPDPNAPPERNANLVIRNIHLWRNGFSIEDGERRDYEEPAQRAILESILEGTAPISVLGVEIGQEVELRVQKHHNEDWTPSQGPGTFVGEGHRLGAPVYEATSSRASSSSMPGDFPAAPASTSATAEPESITTRFEVDQNLPTTSVQVRLADGTRLVSRMNLTHTVGDIRNFINASRPENRVRDYTIATTFPNRILDNNAETIEAAKLQNSVVVQRWV